jgi:nucleoside-diphosphate-sugar epimerase
LFEGSTGTVFHLAGLAHTSIESAEECARAKAVNVDGAGALLHEAQRAGVRRAVLLSSSHVYGSSGVNVPEDAPLHPASFYAETKVAMEEIGWRAVTAGLDVIVARPSLCYGPGVVFNLHAMLSAIGRGRYFHIGGRTPERSFASVHTVSSSLLHLAEHGSSGFAYNVADREPVTLCSFADDLSERMGKPKPKTLPHSLAWCGAALLTAVAAAGVRVPLTLESLEKLTAPFSLDLSRLATTGFRWPDAVDRTRQQMVDAYFRQLAGER